MRASNFLSKEDSSLALASVPPNSAFEFMSVDVVPSMGCPEL